MPATSSGHGMSSSACTLSTGRFVFSGPTAGMVRLVCVSRHFGPSPRRRVLRPPRLSLVTCGPTAMATSTERRQPERACEADTRGGSDGPRDGLLFLTSAYSAAEMVEWSKTPDSSLPWLREAPGLERGVGCACPLLSPTLLTPDSKSHSRHFPFAAGEGACLLADLAPAPSEAARACSVFVWLTARLDAAASTLCVCCRCGCVSVSARPCGETRACVRRDRRLGRSCPC